MADQIKGEPDGKDPADGRRKGDRRQSQQLYDGPDRRKGDRRSGGDRRTTPRN
ncbi:hypothetical protein [Erythrobacter sanguineus]|uniref:Uncharacterized protein n=1 Tax=Erythrobacter sanguineus TaxID=198312 RepID=A0A1M7SL53_9SPHN|nr:hypothetical protein [Erythrobacter sanguineus]SHN59194.1 hypothetical protein SAMN02745193_01947 [Erythrobacter sanguineus]